MAELLTKEVDVDAFLLERLRQRCPGVTDRERLETTAKLFLGRKALHLMQERNEQSEEAALELGVEAVREARHRE
ncbi:MAG TPA: hypothetical protein VN756_04555 [Solirubrobacterales bacterium]|nr:hypothetical protein [Solirubrobacterales bacterium]